jgi:hypothetical protein
LGKGCLTLLLFFCFTTTKNHAMMGFATC